MDARRGQKVPTGDYECLIAEVNELLGLQGDEQDPLVFCGDAQKTPGRFWFSLSRFES